MPNTRLPYRINVSAPALTAADIEQQSPLWPLQSQLRGIVSGAINSGAASAGDVARISATNATVESLFGQWQNWPLATLREAIRLKISPPPEGELDLTGNPTLAGFQQALLGATHWADTLS